MVAETTDLEKRTLPTLRAGEAGVVKRIIAAQGRAKRLADMGFVRGAWLEMVRPGSPCIVRINGVCIGLGSGYQHCIELATVQEH